jgi:uncharacterized integral membrane protein
MSDERNEERYVQQEAASGTTGAPPWKLIALLILVVAVAIFFFQNGSRAPVQFLWLDGSWPIWAVIGISIVAGIVLDRLVVWQWRRARRNKDAAKRS